MQNVEVDGIAGAQRAIRKHVRVRAAAFARNRVHAFDVFRAHVVQNFAREADRFVFLDARPQKSIQLFVRRIHHAGGHVEQYEFVLRLDHADVGHQLLAVDDCDAELLQSEENGRLDDVDADGLVREAAHFKLDLDLHRHIFGAPHFGRHGSAQERDAGARPVAEPGAIQLVVAGGRAEIPQDGLVVLGQQSEAADFILRPGADVRRGEVPHVVHVEAQQRAHFGLGEGFLGAREALFAEAVEIDALLPIHSHCSVTLYGHFDTSTWPGAARRSLNFYVIGIYTGDLAENRTYRLLSWPCSLGRQQTCFDS